MEIQAKIRVYKIAGQLPVGTAPVIPLIVQRPFTFSEDFVRLRRGHEDITVSLKELKAAIAAVTISE